MENGIKVGIWLQFGTKRVGRLRFHQFNEFLNEGMQFYPYATLFELKRSWKITKRLLSTRAAPRVQPGSLNGIEGIFVYRRARIVGEESLMKRLNATKFTSEKVMFL
jgi:hypothetical protein